MASFLDNCVWNATSTGTGDFVVATAVAGSQTPASANAVNAAIYHYYARSADSSQWEIGGGAYTVAGTTQARTTVLFNSSGTTAKISFSTVPIVAMVALVEDVREKLDAARTYYVSTTGSDSNNGLAVGTPFLTIQKAVNTVSALDIGGFTITIQVADGTYTGAVALKNAVGFAAAGNLVIQGNNTTPANVLISTTSADGFSASNISSIWDIKDLKITTTTSGTAINADNSAVRFGNLNFGSAATAHIISINGAKVTALSNYAVSGGSAFHLYASGLALIDVNTKTITFSNTPAFSGQTVAAADNAAVFIYSMTFTNGATVTGTRYSATRLGNIFTSGGGANYIPGSVAGSAATGGQYN